MIRKKCFCSFHVNKDLERVNADDVVSERYFPVSLVRAFG